jgi:hypothetical protein
MEKSKAIRQVFKALQGKTSDLLTALTPPEQPAEQYQNHFYNFQLVIGRGEKLRTT